jgi:hypothetical protein
MALSANTPPLLGTASTAPLIILLTGWQIRSYGGTEEQNSFGCGTQNNYRSTVGPVGAVKIGEGKE